MAIPLTIFRKDVNQELTIQQFKELSHQIVNNVRKVNTVNIMQLVTLMIKMVLTRLSALQSV